MQVVFLAIQFTLQRQKARFYSGFEFSVAAGNVLFLQQLHNRKCVRMKEWQRNKLLVEGKGCALMTDENRKKRCRGGRGNFGCDEKNKYCCRRKAFVFLWRFLNWMFFQAILGINCKWVFVYAKPFVCLLFVLRWYGYVRMKLDKG